MTTAHANLTGTDLHEIKGASTATAGQVPISNGLGSTPFGLIPPSSLTAEAKPFQSSLLHVQETHADGSSSDFSAPTSYTSMPLGTVKTNEISGSTIGSNYVILPTGTYYFEGYITYAATLSFSKGRARLYDLTHGVPLINSPTASGQGQWSLPLNGRFTIASNSTIVVQSFCTAGNVAPSGAGGGNEIFTDLRFWKIA